MPSWKLQHEVGEIAFFLPENWEISEIAPQQ